MSEPYRQELDAALAAVRQAAAVCRAVQGAIAAGVMDKQDRSPVTVADFASQAVICRALGEAFPDDPIVGEEDAAALSRPENRPLLDRAQRELHSVGIAASAEQICGWIDRGNMRGRADRFWTLDPIDGTKGFLRGEQYAVSLALLIRGQIEVGLLGCPNLPVDPDQPEPRGALFFAVRGQGAWRIPLDGEPHRQPIRVSDTADPAAARLCESVESGHSAHDRSARIAQALGLAREPVRMDSQAKYAAVARGEADIYLRLPTRPDYRENIWDHAGGVLLVEEAGGTVTDIDGRPLDFTHGPRLESNQGVIVATPALHPRVLAAVRAS